MTGQASPRLTLVIIMTHQACAFLGEFSLLDCKLSEDENKCLTHSSNPNAPKVLGKQELLSECLANKWNNEQANE